jgi:histone H3/H4
VSSEQETPPRLINRGPIHHALRKAHGRASPEATTVLGDALDRIAAALIHRADELARIDRKRTILERHARQAFNDFMFPKQGLSRAAQVLRESLDEIDRLVRSAPSELPSPSLLEVEETEEET